jgi:uncharacterized membrane protein YhhN
LPVVSGNNESMTSTVVVFLVVASIFSVGDWWAVQAAKKSLEYLCKPLATVAFLGAAIAILNADGVSQTWRIIAFVFCLLGDVFLMLPRDAFVPGLASFAVAQICFAVSLLTQDSTLNRLIVGLIIVVPTTLFLARRFVKSISTSGHKELVVPVVVYMMVIAAMAVSAMAGGTALGIVGALFFMLSDSLIAEHRFVKERAWQPVGIMVTYHLALAGLALGLL